MKRLLVYAAAVLAAGAMTAGPSEVWAAEETETAAQVIESAYTKGNKKKKVTEEDTAAAKEVSAAENISPAAVIAEKTAEAVETFEEAVAAEVQAQAEAREEAERQETIMNMRQHLVNYALQFVGNPYLAGGNDPHTGADCSGFVRYVMQNGAGIYMNRSSCEQAQQGTRISSEQMQPGDLLFYASGSHINHVAMYIGNGKIVHASTERTGIKTSVWNYRTPVRIVSMFS